MEILIAIAPKIVEYTVKPVGQWLCYSFYYSSNIGRMKNHEEELRHARDRVQHSIDAAIRNGYVIEGDVNKWLKDVDEITELAKKVLEGEEEARTKGYNGACLNLKLRYQLSRKAKKIVKDIGEVLKKGSFDRVSYHSAPQGEVTTSCTDYVDFESRKSTMKRLMEALRDDNIHVIGVWGMPGVGKSTLVREVANQAKEEKLFDEVALANVTHSPDVGQIQGEIADALGLKFDEETVPGRARRLQERLTKMEAEKKILVILDDIWDYLDLKKIGIPSDHELCKVLLTSRNQDVLVSRMDTQKDFGLEVLGKEEAWSLFEKMAGVCIKDPNLGSTTTNVANACAGLPLALVTVSKALKNKELFEWKNALLLLRRPASEHLTKMQLTIYSSIELSYKHLEIKEVREVFLLCAQQDYYIHEMDLLKYCYGLGLFHGINTMEDARNRLSTILRSLKDCCLLLQSPYSSKNFRMHDVVGDAAKLIASRKDHNMFVMRVDGGLKEWLDADALKRCEAFSVLGGDIHELPNEMECPKLRFLHVSCDDNRPLQIPDTFFEGMGELKVLHWTKMQLSSLPLLRNLQTLCLDQCVMGNIAVIGELKNLTILSLLKSNISQLPREIGLLTRLRLLDLSDCSKLEVIPPNVLSSLIALEELYMRNSFVQWKTEGLNNASLAELKHLSHLTTLEIHIPDANNLPKDLSFDKLEKYIIFVGDVWDWSDSQEEASITLKLKLNTSFQLEVGIKMLLKRTENLYLDQLKGVNSVLHELDSESFQQLKHLHIQNNPEIKYIINSRMHLTAFPSLETFILKNMTGLDEICHGQLPLTSFANLRFVKVEQCDKLKFVFPSSIARTLSQLEELEIRECSIIGAIVMKEEGDIEDEDTLNLFSKLRCLALQHLPKFMSLLTPQNSLVTDIGEIISEGRLDFHMPILYEQVLFPKLERLELSSIGLEDVQHNQDRATRSSCILANMRSASRFPNLLHLEVQGFGNIKYLLSFSTARYMVQLKHLHIFECKVMEEILVTEETIPKVLFPRLECLFLKELPILKRFCEGSNIKFPSLKYLMIEHCPKLKTFISKPISLGVTTSKELKEMNAEESPHIAVQPLFNEEVVFPNSESLQLSSIGLEDIQHNQRRATRPSCRLENMQSTSRFQNMSNLVVKGSNNIKYLLSFSTARSMVQLKGLHISECKVMEEILVTEDLRVVEEIPFPRLEILILKELPILERFCQGSNFKFSSLKKLEIDNCPKLKTFISKPVSLGMMTSCKELKEMNAEESPHTAMQPLFNEEVVFPNLETLQLSSIGLEGIQHNQHRATWSSCRLGMQSTLRFQNLLELTVKGCGNIKYLLSFSTAEFMVQLKGLQISECKAMEEILLTEDLEVVEEIIPKVLFPQLEALVLKELPLLERFCQGSNIKFLSLEGLVLDHCPKLKTFIFKPVSSCMTTSKELKEMNTEESPHTVVQPLFNEEVAFPSLESLLISHVDDLKIIWQNQFAIDSFYKLQVLKVLFCKNLVNVFQFDMLARFQSLEKLVVVDCGSLEEVFELEGLNVTETHAITIIQLKELFLKDLPNMRHVWSKDPKQIFSFQKLQRVRVMGCWGLKSLFPASVATCLTQLEDLHISCCVVLEEIVAGEEAAQQIARFLFPQVTVLHLAMLPRLNWFYPGVHTSEWPMLKDMLVADCPKVEIFASELSSFQDILLRESKLEIPIKQPLFLVKEAPFPSLEKLRIAYMLDLKIIWHNQFTADSFCNPQILKVEFCENLTVQETCAVTATQFKELHLIHLPKLKHIWNEDPQQIFSFPGAEEDFPFDVEVMVKEICLMLENSSESYPSGANT